MTAVSQARRAALGVPRTRSWRSSVNRGVTREHRIALLLGAVSVLWTALIVVLPSKTPTTALMIPLLFGSLVLGPRILPGFIALLMVCVTVAILVQDTITDRFLNATIVMYLMGLIVFVMSRRRSRLGVGGVRGESMLIDLRDRILTQGTIPQLPPEWDVQSALRSAGGTPFAGDFVVAAKSDADRRLEVAVVDVSGKGEQAGTRALLLSGAFGGLLGTLPPEQFLPAANAYLLHQEWDEGFATAVHMSLDLDTGAFEIRTAGHPPAAHRLAGLGALAGAAQRRTRPGPDRRRDVHGLSRSAEARRRGAALHRRHGGEAAPRHRPRHRPDAGGGRGAAARDLRGRCRPVGRRPGLARRRPGDADGAPALTCRLGATAPGVAR